MKMHECTFHIDFFCESKSDFELPRDMAKSLLIPGTPRCRASALSNSSIEGYFDEVYGADCHEKDLTFAGGIQFSFDAHSRYGQSLSEIRHDRFLEEKRSGMRKEYYDLLIERKIIEEDLSSLSIEEMISSLACYYGFIPLNKAIANAATSDACHYAPIPRLNNKIYDNNQFLVYGTDHVEANQTIFVTDYERSVLMDIQDDPDAINNFRLQLLKTQDNDTELCDAMVLGLESVETVAMNNKYIISTDKAFLNSYSDFILSRYPSISQKKDLLQSWVMDMQAKKAKKLKRLADRDKRMWANYDLPCYGAGYNPI